MRDEADITHAMASTVCRGFASQPRLGLLCSDALYAVVYDAVDRKVGNYYAYNAKRPSP